MFISAKHATGNDEKNLGKTVKGWVDQEPHLRPGDVLALAINRIDSKDVEQLPAAVLKHRASPGTPMIASAAKAFTALTEMIAKKTDDTAVRSRVLDAGFVLQIKVMKAGDTDWELAATLLESHLVPAGHGLAAMDALAEAFHTQASLANASDLGGWIDILRQANIPLIAKPGTPGSEEYARQVALDKHRARLAADAGRVELALLAEDLPPLTVTDLADGLQVAVARPTVRRQSPEELLVIARRWPRMLLTGLPGKGKSTALRQLAATWAGDPLAPVPVLVSLPAVARRCAHASQLTLRLLCEEAAPADADRADLVAALELACRNGDAVLLLDAFDECGTQRPMIADGLATVFAELSEQTGVVLATRGSGTAAAGRLQLPVADLATASNLKTILREVIRHVAAHRDVPAAERDDWVAVRWARVRTAIADHPDIGQVPLLATLLTLVVADEPGASLGHSRAQLLHTAVQHSVRRWESRRSGAAGTQPGQPSQEQLLAGFAALGRRLVEPGPVTVAAAEHSVAAMLTARWHASPGEADEATRHILDFWDNQVGVFVDTDGVVVPRSRIFAEIGAAIAVKWLSDGQVPAWVSAAVGDDDRGLTLTLAGELDPRILLALLTDTGDGSMPARALAATRVLRGTPTGDAALLSILLAALAEAAGQAVTASGSPAGPDEVPAGWTYILEVAQLRVPAGQRDQRDQILNLLPTGAPRTVAVALAALADAGADLRPLTTAETTAVRTALQLPLPDMTERPRQHHDLLPGHLDIALQAIAHLGELGPDMAAAISELAWHDRLNTVQEVDAALQALGHHLEPPSWVGIPSVVRRSGARSDTEPDGLTGLSLFVLPLLQTVAGLSPVHSVLTAGQRWRLDQLCALAEALDLGAADPGDVLTIDADKDGLALGCLRACATLLGLDAGVVAAQAAAALVENRDSAPLRMMTLFLATGPLADPLDAADPDRLGTDGKQALIAALAGDGSWMAQAALQALAVCRDDELRDRIITLLPDAPSDRRGRLAGLACQVSSDPSATARQLADHDDPAVRTAARWHLGQPA